MTLDEFEGLLNRSVYEHFFYLQKQTPYRTGNLAYNALKIKKTAKGYDITIDLSVAPYGQYINEQANYRTYGWWNKAVMDYINDITRDLGGTLEEL